MRTTSNSWGILEPVSVVLGLLPAVLAQNGSLWAMKSQMGGGYAGQAVVDPITNELHLTGTMWDTQFLNNWRVRTNINSSTSDPTSGSSTGTSKCFLTTMELGTSSSDNVRIRGDSQRSFQLPQSCRCMTLHRPFSTNVREANPTDTLNPIYTMDDTSSLLMGYQSVSSSSTSIRTSRVQQTMTMVNLATYKTRQQQLQGSPTVDSANPGRFSLYDPFDAQSNSLSEDYQHQSQSFTFPIAAIAERSMTLDDATSEYAAPQGQSQNVFVAVTQSEQVPNVYHLESMQPMMEQVGAPSLTALLPQFYYRQLVQPDWVRTGYKSETFQVPTQGGVQKVDAASGLLAWYTPFVGEEGFNDGQVMVTSVAYAPATRYGEFVLVAGSVQSSSGPLLGTHYNRAVRGGPNDWDGFVTKLNAQTGLRWEPPSGQDASFRIKSSGDGNDWVTALCFQHPDIAYVIGTTTGKVVAGNSVKDGGVFILKMDIDTMQIKWQIQLEGLGVIGTACAISEEEPSDSSKNLLFVSGVLPRSHPGFNTDGTQKQGSGNERASEDSFVVAFDADSSSGNIEWIQEIQYHNPSQQHPRSDEFISSLSINAANGHVVAFGNSYNVEEDENDVFAVALDRDSGRAGDLAGIGASVPSPTPAPTPTQPTMKQASTEDDRIPAGAVAASVLVPLLVFVAVGTAIVVRRRRISETETKPSAGSGVAMDDLMLEEDADEVEWDENAKPADPDPVGVSAIIT